MLPVGLEIAKIKLQSKLQEILTQPTPDAEGKSDIKPKSPDVIAKEMSDAIHEYVKSAQISSIVCPPPSGVQVPLSGFLQ